MITTMVVDPINVAPGGTVTVTRETDEVRGLSYNLLRKVDGEWTCPYLLFPAREPAEVRRLRPGESVIQPAIAIRGGFPEEVPIPADAPPGEYRLSAGGSSFVQITVHGAADQPS